jgi:hypothetical protein
MLRQIGLASNALLLVQQTFRRERANEFSQSDAFASVWPQSANSS